MFILAKLLIKFISKTLGVNYTESYHVRLITFEDITLQKQGTGALQGLSHNT